MRQLLSDVFIWRMPTKGKKSLGSTEVVLPIYSSMMECSLGIVIWNFELSVRSYQRLTGIQYRYCCVVNYRYG